MTGHLILIVETCSQPKSKDHLRIISQLRLETGEFEVASEAALHRLTQSTAALPPITPRANRNPSLSTALSPFGGQRHSSFGSSLSSMPFETTTSGTPFGGNTDRRPPSSSGRPPVPTKNRFPEAAVMDDDEDHADSSGSDQDLTGNEMLSDAGFADDDAMSAVGDGQAPSEAPTVRNSAWSLRDPSSSLWAAQSKPLTPGAPVTRTAEVDVCKAADS